MLVVTDADKDFAVEVQRTIAGAASTLPSHPLIWLVVAPAMSNNNASHCKSIQGCLGLELGRENKGDCNAC